MSKNKLEKFAALDTFPNVFQHPHIPHGSWKDVFQNTQPLSLELACGKGEYTIGLAKLYPRHNYIGIDIKGNRLWSGAQKALAEGLSNALFVRASIDHLLQYFAKQEVEDIWLTFPDPFVKNAKWRKRLTHPKFLRIFHHIMKPSGTINLKTDSPDLVLFTQKVLDLYALPLYEQYEDLYTFSDLRPELSIKTYYEGLNISQSNKIYYMQFGLRDSLLDTDKDILLKQIL